MKVFSTISPKLVEYIGKSSWRIRWNIEKSENLYSYNEAEFNRKPSLQEIKNTILASFNEDIDSKILSGFTWNDMQVWLSSENQFNYKTAYDLAVQTNGSSLPVTFKFGSSDNPKYHTFETLEDLSDFYIKAANHVIKTLDEGWKLKDAIDWSNYCEGTGTKEDPLEFTDGLVLKLGVYYKHNGLTYLCYKDSELSVSSNEFSNYVSVWQ